MCPCGKILSLNPWPDHLYQAVTEGQWKEGQSPHQQPCPIRNRLSSTDIHTHIHCQHICSTAYGPVQCPSCDTGQLKKGREHVWTPHAAVLRDEGQSNLLSQLQHQNSLWSQLHRGQTQQIFCCAALLR